MLCISVWIYITCYLFIQVKSEVENMTDKTYVEYIAVKYRTQFVAGTNYVVKVNNIVIFENIK